MRDTDPQIVLATYVLGVLFNADVMLAGTDVVHGSAEDQQAAFNRGFLGDCTSYLP